MEKQLNEDVIPKVDSNRQKGDKAESFFETIIRDVASPIKVRGSLDIGVDYFCEYNNKETPTGVVFAAQVKFRSASIKFIGKDTRLNLLDTYQIKPTVSIEPKTKNYWKLLGIPTYLFVVIPDGENFDLYYKRFTPSLLGKTPESSCPFYKVNRGIHLCAFAKDKIGGFTRDLYIDQIRSDYSKGLVTYLNPRRLGLEQFPNIDSDMYFTDILVEYRKELEKTYSQLKVALDLILVDTSVKPSEAPPGSN